jgi:glyoxylase-like metal-dependent hydrolase (beta-lactamase superfamily II)/rhodanese-related sulfurtransferase
VDPRFETDEYLDLARYMGVSIEHVLETHNHADHVSGHGRLAAATGASIHIHRDAEPGYDHEPFDDGWELELGALTVRALHTPGHRPEHTAFALIDTARSDEPWALLSGDTLFVGDVARPDLAIEKADGARGIFRSLHGQLLTLPDRCEVWPGHLGGSMCGGPGMDMKISTTIGFEKANNPTLQITDEDEFVEEALANLGPQPPNFQAIVELNKGPLLTSGVELLPLAPRQVEQKRAAGALLVDVRTDQQFDDAHIAGSVCIPMMRAGFGSKLAWLANREQEIVLIGRDDTDGRHAGELAIAVGIRKLGGFLHGGMTSWRQDKQPAERIERITVEELVERSEKRALVQIWNALGLTETGFVGLSSNYTELV